METIFDLYERKRLRDRNRAASTIINHRKAAQDFLRHLEDSDPLTVDEETCQAWVNSNHYAPRTRNMYCDRVGAVYRYAHQKGIIAANPFVDVEKSRVPEETPRIISIAKLREIRDNCIESSRDDLLFHLLAYTGMREHEIANLCWGPAARNFLEETPHGLQANIVGKGGYLRLVPLHPVLEERVKQYSPRPGNPLLWPLGGRQKDERPLTGPAVYAALNGMWPDRPKDGKSACHSFRKTVASSLDENGVTESMIERLLGWRRRTIFDKHYRNVSDKRMFEAMALLYADDPL